jgi:trimeric autotransporter adhesin
MRRSIENSGEAYRTRLVPFLMFLSVSILVIGGPDKVWGEPPAIPNSETWITNGPVYAIANEGGTTYIGGDFTYVGPCTGNGVPIDEATGLVLSLYPKVNGPVKAVIADGSGGWYIGGEFTSVGGVERNRIAHIFADGSLDSPWNPNANGWVYALAVSGETVYVGGDFGSIGGQPRNRIAALDAVTGEVTSWNPDADNPVRALAVGSGTVYAGGDFGSIGGHPRYGIAALDAVTGQAMSWNAQAAGSVYALVVSDGMIYVGGDFISIGGEWRNRIAALDAATGQATTWNPNSNYAVLALAVSEGTVYAGGWFTSIGGQWRSRIAALDALTGRATPWIPDSDERVNTLSVRDGTVYAGGRFRRIGGEWRAYVAAIDTATGHATPWNPNTNDWVYAMAISGGTAYAGGEFTSIGGEWRNNIAALDTATGQATTWNPNANYEVCALAVSGGTVYAGGYFNGIGGQVRSGIAALDPVTGQATSWDPGGGGGVRALVVNDGIVYVGGQFWSIGGQPRRGIAAIDASTGQVTPWDPTVGDEYGLVSALVVSGDTVYVGGWFPGIGGKSRSNIAALDLSTGKALPWNPSAINGGVDTLVVSGRVVYAGGGFTDIGGQPRNSIAALDAITGQATSWDPNINYGVHALAVSGGTVYAGGAFFTAGGQVRRGIGAIDAVTGQVTSWNPNPDGGVHALAVSGGTVYAGGEFWNIEGNPRYNFAQFGVNRITASPNRFDFGAVTIGSTSLPLTLTITNLVESELPIDSVLLSGPDVDDFVVQSDLCSGNVLASSGSCTVQLAFTSVSPGLKSAYVTVSSSQPEAWTFDVPLAGIGRVTEITLVSPNGGEILYSGSEYVIGWAAPPEATSFRLFYSIDKGSSWEPLTARAPVKGLSYPWRVPKGIGNRSDCRIRVVGYNGSQVIGSDACDAPFSIEVVKLLSPNGGEVIHPGEATTIEWRASPATDHFDLVLSTDSGITWKFIRGGKGVTEKQLITGLPVPETGNRMKCLIKVVAYWPSGTTAGSDRSDTPFSIEVVKLRAPNGGGLPLKSGALLTITWDTYTTAEPITKVLLFYTLNGGTTWKPITTLPGGSSSHEWIIPEVATAKTRCKVKVVLKDAAGVLRGSDTSDLLFAIEP